MILVLSQGGSMAKRRVLIYQYDFKGIKSLKSNLRFIKMFNNRI